MAVSGLSSTSALGYQLQNLVQRMFCSGVSVGSGNGRTGLDEIGATGCASDCHELFGGNVTNGWLWKYAIQAGGIAPPPSPEYTNHTSDCLSCDFAANNVYCEAPDYSCKPYHLVLELPLYSLSATVSSVSRKEWLPPNRSIWQQHIPSAGVNFLRNVVSFPRFRFRHQVPCNGTQVLSVTHVNLAVRFVLVSAHWQTQLPSWPVSSGLLGAKNPDKRKNATGLASNPALYFFLEKRMFKDAP